MATSDADKDPKALAREAARETARRLARDYNAQGSPLGWFEVFYDQAQGDEKRIAWADMLPNRNLTAWLEQQSVSGAGQPALVVGCGLGDDAEHLAQLGFTVTAFDVAPTAIGWCQRRFPSSSVGYVVGDVLRVPDSWHTRFSFIFEAYTLQVLPDDLHRQAMQQIAACLAPGGTLLVVARGRDPEEATGAVPWPLTRDDLGYFRQLGLDERRFEDYPDGGTRRFRVEYRKP